MEQNGVIARVPAGEAGPLWNCGGEVVKPGLPSADGMITQMGNQVFMAQISALKILKFLTGTEEQTTGQKQPAAPGLLTLLAELCTETEALRGMLARIEALLGVSGE